MSTIQIGKKSVADTPAGLLLDCHARIRSHAELAVRLAVEQAPDDDLAGAAARVHRYFTEALPLHVADEEQSLAPRLHRFAPDVARAVATMEREHGAHDEVLARLIPAWSVLRGDPRDRHDTHADAIVLQRMLDEHLAGEERIVIPAMTRLPVDEQRALLDEMRARRR